MSDDDGDDGPLPMILREDPSGRAPPILREVLLSHGWRMFDEAAYAENGGLPSPLSASEAAAAAAASASVLVPAQYSLYWKTNRFFPSEIKSCRYPHQRVNHYPKSSEITKKDSLHRHMKRMKVIHGNVYDFLPTTFVLPNEYVKFCQFFADERDRAQAAGREAIFICKPSDLSRGRKIFVFKDIADLTYDCSSVVQRYVDNPLLIRGHKVDFRIYVLVTSFHPLKAYIFQDGLVRFSVDRYNLDDVRNVFAHLTNYSINKNATTINDDKDGIGAGCKWDLEQARAFFTANGVDFSVMWNRIEVLVCLTLLSITHEVPQMAQCFELYGFDILFDATFQPWLMEVNFSPALAVESDVDQRVKGPLMWDMVQSLNIQPMAAASAKRKCGDAGNTDARVDGKSTNGAGSGALPPRRPSVPAVSKRTTPAPAPTSVPSPAPAPGRSAAASKAPAPPVPRGRQPNAPSVATAAGAAVGLRRRAASSAAIGAPSPTTAPRGALRSSDSVGFDELETAGSVNIPSTNNSGVAAMARSASARRGSGSTGAKAPVAGESSVRKQSSVGDAASAAKTARAPPLPYGAVDVNGVALVDKPHGKFKWCFPYSPETEVLAQQLATSAPDVPLRKLIQDLKKRDARNAAAIKPMCARYNEAVAATASEASTTTSAGRAGGAGWGGGAVRDGDVSCISEEDDG